MASAERGVTSRAELALGYHASEGPLDAPIARAQRAVREHPNDVNAHLALAISFSKKHRQTSDASLMIYARDAVASARALAPEEPKVLALAALVASEQHRFREARELARRVIARAPSDPTGHLILGDALLELGEAAPAIASYQRAMDLRPDLRSYNRGAYSRWLHGDIAGALELYELALDAGSSRDPESLAWCWVDVGQLELERGDARRAKAAAARALQLVPDYVPALALEARALSDLSEPEAAIARLERAVARAANAEDLLLLAELERRLGRTQAAERRRAQAEKLAERSPRALALHWARHGEHAADALRLAERELAERPNVWSHDVHALALLRSGDVSGAARAIELALALGTPVASFELHRGLIRLAEGDRARAAASLRRALALNPNVDPLLVTELRRGLANGARG